MYKFLCVAIAIAVFTASCSAEREWKLNIFRIRDVLTET